MQIIKGKLKSAQKVVVYGPEGIGKSTFAAHFPLPLFIDTEGSTTHMDVARTTRPSSWTMLLDQVQYVRSNPNACRTLVIDTADWAEMLCASHICAKANVSGIESFGYGKGYTYLEEEFGKFLNLLQEVISAGIHVVLTAHAQMRKFEQPDELGAYDRWELKLEKKTAPLLKEWADMVLFANYKTYVINVDNQGATKGKNKAQGGSRVMYTTHHPCWDAKNRHDLPAELPFEYASIAGIFENTDAGPDPVSVTIPQAAPPPASASASASASAPQPAPAPTAAQQPVDAVQIPESIPKPLHDLMQPNQVTVAEIQAIVAQKGYYPADTPIGNYDPDFISGVLVGAWHQVYGAIVANRRTDYALPFNV